MATDRDGQALKLLNAGWSVERIQKEMRFRTLKSATDAILRAVRSGFTTTLAADEFRAKEVAMLEDLHQQIYPKALKGDSDMLDKVLKIADLRYKLRAEPDRADGKLLPAFEDMVENLTAAPVDSTILQAGRELCKQIDFTLKHGTPFEVTKALYLMPHLVNILRELQATPSARGNLAGAIKEAGGGGAGNVDSLEAWKAEKRSGKQKKS